MSPSVSTLIHNKNLCRTSRTCCRSIWTQRSSQRSKSSTSCKRDTVSSLRTPPTRAAHSRSRESSSTKWREPCPMLPLSSTTLFSPSYSPRLLIITTQVSLIAAFIDDFYHSLKGNVSLYQEESHWTFQSSHINSWRTSTRLTTILAMRGSTLMVSTTPNVRWFRTYHYIAGDLPLEPHLQMIDEGNDHHRIYICWCDVLTLSSFMTFSDIEVPKNQPKDRCSRRAALWWESSLLRNVSRASDNNGDRIPH